MCLNILKSIHYLLIKLYLERKLEGLLNVTFNSGHSHSFFKSSTYLSCKVAAAGYDRQGVADHANNLASKIRSNLTNSMKSLGVDILKGFGTVLVSLCLTDYYHLLTSLSANNWILMMKLCFAFSGSTKSQIWRYCNNSKRYYNCYWFCAVGAQRHRG